MTFLRYIIFLLVCFFASVENKKTSKNDINNTEYQVNITKSQKNESMSINYKVIYMVSILHVFNSKINLI